MNQSIKFVKASLNHWESIKQWLEEPHVKEFWDNSPEHAQDILIFIKGRTEKSPYWDGIFTYWIGEFNREPYCLLMTSEILANQPDLTELWKSQLSANLITLSIDFMIGNKKFLGKGLAALTLEKFTFHLQQTNNCVDTFFIDPSSSNTKAIHVYEKAGFNKVAPFVRNSINHVLMVKKSYLRVMLEQDIEKIVNKFCFPWSTKEQTMKIWETYYHEQQQGIRTVVIIEKNNEIIGYGSFLRKSENINFANIPEINAIWIDEKHRRQGWGTSLIKWIEELAIYESYNKIGIGVGLYADYGPAQKLYCKLGYLPEGKGVTYKGKTILPGESYPLDDDYVFWLTKSF